jgi:hypothetical protein
VNIKEDLDRKIQEFSKMELFKFLLVLPLIFLKVLNEFKGIVNDYIEIARKLLKSYLCYFCIHIPFYSNVSLNALLELDEYRLENVVLIRNETWIGYNFLIYFKGTYRENSFIKNN